VGARPQILSPSIIARGPVPPAKLRGRALHGLPLRFGICQQQARGACVGLACGLAAVGVEGGGRMPSARARGVWGLGGTAPRGGNEEREKGRRANETLSIVD
jgi:hypothetical protein